MHLDINVTCVSTTWQICQNSLPDVYNSSSVYLYNCVLCRRLVPAWLRWLLIDIWNLHICVSYIVLRGTAVNLVLNYWLLKNNNCVSYHLSFGFYTVICYFLFWLRRFYFLEESGAFLLLNYWLITKIIKFVNVVLVVGKIIYYLEQLAEYLTDRKSVV